MTKEEAINLISQVLANFRGSLQDHKILQEALSLIKKLLEEDKK